MLDLPGETLNLSAPSLHFWSKRGCLHVESAFLGSGRGGLHVESAIDVYEEVILQ